MLLLGAGAGEATCGILYLAGYLRRFGVEAYVRLFDDDETEEAIARSLEQLVARVRPKLVGVSLKWFHHLARARLIARTLEAIDPELRVVLGGNSASYWWRELSEWSCVDHLALGDGEVPLLALARGAKGAPNVVTRADDGLPKRAPLDYVQGAKSDDVYYSHFDEIFLSRLDQHSFSGWVAPGKGCGENCVYCGGGRGTQKASFGRARPFLRPVASVRQDHLEVVPRTWQLRYDFSGSSTGFLRQAWEGVDLSKHSTTYFLWGVPPPELAETLSRTFQRAFMVLDIGCFAESQRLELMRRGLLKPCPTDAELLEVIASCRRFGNLELEISGIAGLPLASAQTLDEEVRLVSRVLEAGCVVGYQRLEAQPGALVTEHPGRFEMVSEASTFAQFLEFFEARGAAALGPVPMVRFADPKLEAAVARTSARLEAAAQQRLEKRHLVSVNGRTRLLNASAATSSFELGEWLGAHRVPARLAGEKVTVVRSADGTGVACAPSLKAKSFADPAVQPGKEGAALLAVLAAFERPTTVDAAVARLKAQARLDPGVAHEVIEHLAAGQFLRPA